MRVRVCLGVLLAIVLVTLTPVAYIDTPDQLWLGGYYDSDEDDAIVHIQTHLNAVEPAALTSTPSSVPCVHAPPPLYERVARCLISSARHPRAPPTSASA
jgi:hypothetical protein